MCTQFTDPARSGIVAGSGITPTGLALAPERGFERYTNDRADGQFFGPSDERRKDRDPRTERNNRPEGFGTDDHDHEPAKQYRGNTVHPDLAGDGWAGAVHLVG